MKRHLCLLLFSGWLLTFSVRSLASDAKVLTNHLGYEAAGPKHAVILGKATDSFSACALKDEASDQQVLSVPAKAAGPVEKWRDWYFWMLDFDSFSTEGQYYLECASEAGSVRSFPFLVQRNLLQRNTMQDVIYYFKAERSSGEYDKADSHLRFEAAKKGTWDAHGGWWDATGDYGKHFSHLSFSTYFNPQQIPLVVYSLLKSFEQNKLHGPPELARYQAHLLDEAIFGADYLVRMKAPGGSFYRSVSNGGVDQVPEKRKIAGEMKRFGIEAAPGQGAKGMVESAENEREYEVSYRSGGGIAIAALAMASMLPVSGQFTSADYLKSAEDAFDDLEKDNLKLVNDGKENIVDDYCALAAATELYRATRR
ncbi:MAG TPA: glycoside hydrolase family 9 protein, partial [Candidatus Acidoferrales bacterium]|nr:glycoside hydrolase family 9 protein [Candidatus Acidoferrales bacterium]